MIGSDTLRRKAKKAAGIAFIVWTLAFLVPVSISIMVKWARGDAAVDHYALSYSVVVGGIVLAFRKPVARLLRRSAIPRPLSFLALSVLLCAIEEVLCFVTRSGAWANDEPLYPTFLVSTAALTGWATGVFLSGRWLRLGMVELLFVTGLAGWFQELMIYRPGALLSAPLAGLAGLAWVVWSYAILVLIPVSVVPGPDAEPAERGRAWRYPAAFVIPIATGMLLAAVTAVISSAATAQ